MTGESIGELRAFGLAMRVFRQRAGLSQDALADIAGLHRTYIGSVERGERNISLLNIHVIAGALETSASELIHTAEKFRQNARQGRTDCDTLRQESTSPKKR